MMLRPETIQRLNAVTVSAYKTAGFVVLLAILAGLASYLGVQAFFLASRAWVTPMIVSPTHEKVLQLGAKLAEEASFRDRRAAERRELAARLEEAERTLRFERRFQERLEQALRVEGRERAQERAALAALRAQFERADAEIAESNQAYAGFARVRGDALRGASLLDREGYLSLNHQLAQMAQANLSLETARAELETRLSALDRELRGLDAVAVLADGKAAPPAASTRTLDLEQQLARSQVAMARAEAMRDGIRRSVEDADVAVARFDDLIEAIDASPWMRAARGEVTFAFVPYANLAAAERGAPLFACAVGFLGCTRVGRLGAILAGEATRRHPVQNRELRGVLAEIELDDPARAREDVLHLGRKPLFL